MSRLNARNEEAYCVLRLLCEQYPGAFKHDRDKPLPLQIGVRDRLIIELDGVADARAVGLALMVYCRQFRYRQALAAPGAMRHDLTGTAVEPVSKENRQSALAALKPKTSASEPVHFSPKTAVKPSKSKGSVVIPNSAPKPGKSVSKPAPKANKSKGLPVRPNVTTKPGKSAASASPKVRESKSLATRPNRVLQ